MDNLCTYFLDLVQNSIAAKSETITLSMVESNHLHVTIIDDGCGMTEDELDRALSPFYSSRTTRRVGLGLSMMKMLLEQTNGSMKLTSKKHQGTTLMMSFDLSHIDLPDIGDIGELVYFISIHQDVKDFVFIYQKQEEIYRYHLKEIKEILGDALQTFSVMKALIQSINEEINTIRGIT